MENKIKEVMASQEFRREYIKRLDGAGGREYINYEGLRLLGQIIGIKRLQVHPVQIPSADNGMLAVCAAVLEGDNGAVYSDVGDASPDNCSKMTQKHLVRMAATRAKARVLRDYVGVDAPAFEELISDSDTDRYQPTSNKRPSNVKPMVAAVQSTAPSNNDEGNVQVATNSAAYTDACEVCGKPLVPAIVKYSQNKFNRVLCMDCQKNPEAVAN